VASSREERLYVLAICNSFHCYTSNSISSMVTNVTETGRSMNLLVSLEFPTFALPISVHSLDIS
jgi:hypothetical protein